MAHELLSFFCDLLAGFGGLFRWVTAENGTTDFVILKYHVAGAARQKLQEARLIREDY